jgi:lipopolysaccharide/colanic/teichoic acid biosynthesis glycosyltransferase
MYRDVFKPILDMVLSLILLIISSPILLFTFLLLLISNKGSVFFIQPRPGKYAKIFHLVKFKTMNDKKDTGGRLLPDADRLTGAGRFVRKVSFDELPQLFNVITGDMSLIGPRPWLIEYLPLYDDFQKRRHEVKPGITGWAQVNGRNALSWEKRFEYDVYYVDHVSFLLDVKIFILTIWNILSGRGISGEGSVTMEKFQGTKNDERSTK